MDGISLLPGDFLRIERRFVVDGIVTTSTTEGRFAGVQQLGTSEHIALEDAQKEVRLYPLGSVSEITLVQAGPREPKAEARPAPSWDPAVG